MKTLVIDSPFLCHRAIHTMNALSYEEENTGVIFGFLMQLLSYAKTFKTNDIIFCWDSKDSERRKIYPEYKANRKTKEDELSEEEKELKKKGYQQFETLRKEILPAMGFKNVYWQKGYEADDLIATTVMYYERDFVIITADQDMYQLLDFADMWNPTSKEIYNYDDFYTEFKLIPKDWIKIKSYAGCSSDNITGIMGIGEKSAAKFLKNGLKETTKAYKKMVNLGPDILKTNKVLVELPFPGSMVYKMKANNLNFDSFVQNVCYRYSFDSFLQDTYYLKWENFFTGDF